MPTVSDLREKLKRLDFEIELEIAVETTSDTIINKQKDQLLHGLRADGKKIGKYRSRKYAEAKYGMNPLAGLGYMDWRLTQALYNDMYVRIQKGIIDIGSDDVKFEKLVDRFGDPMGLTEKSQVEYVGDVLEPEFIEQVRDTLEL